MYNIIKERDLISYGISEILIDSTGARFEIPTKNLNAGSTCTVVGSGEKYVLNHNKEWIPDFSSNYQFIVENAVIKANQYTDEKVQAVKQFKFKVVNSLPGALDIDPYTIYFVRRTSNGEGTDYYIEYMFVNNQWETLGSTKIDLSGYWNAEEVKDYFKKNKYVLPKASSSTLGGVKIPSNGFIVVNSEGEVDLNDTLMEEIIQNKVNSLAAMTTTKIDSLFL